MKNTLDIITQNKVITICRRVYGEDLLRLADALYEGGIKLIEVTYDQADPACTEKTCASIRALYERFGDNMMFGAGTVLTPDQVVASAEAGARYIISPNVDPDVIAKTKELGLVSIPGAMTPSEILSAHKLGADIVKLFPAGDLGVSYLKAIRAPISHVKLMAVGGVNESNAADFLKAGAVGLGIGGNLAKKAWIDAGEFDKLTEAAKTMVEIIKSVQ